jgi:hypothetical protein
MRPVGGARGPSAAGTERREMPAPANASVSAAAEARALVPTRAATRESDGPTAGQRPYAGFLAHLIATAGQLPQTRQHRRAEPEDAIAVYRSMVNGTQVPTSGKFSRSS